MKRRGGYAWGGPATIELLKTKYFSPHIDEKSFLQLYEKKTLSKIQKTFGITDMWVTYSWGFSHQKEQEQYAFIRQKLPHFAQLGIKTHLYVQGLNLVTADFPKFSGWCRDASGRKLLYSKGRAFICPNHPDTINLLEERVQQAAREKADGVFVDNILFGYPPPFLKKNFLPFFGCNCDACQKLFKKTYGKELLFNTKCSAETIKQYKDFRVKSIESLIKKLSQIVKQEKKEFGINLYDPLLHTPEWNYGYKLTTLLPNLDYLLIENHGLNADIGGNGYLQPLRQQTDKRIFVVSYKDGIGFDHDFSLDEYQKLAEELENQEMHPCYKLTEFVTENVWHAVRFPLKRSSVPVQNTHSLQRRNIVSAQTWEFPFLFLFSQMIGEIIHLYFTSRLFHSLVNRFGQYSRALHTPRLYSDLD